MLVKESPSDMHDTARIDSQKVPVVGEMVDCAQRYPVHDRRYTIWIPVIDDVCSLKKRCLTELADRAASCVCAQDRGAKAMLMEPEHGFPRCIATHIGIGNEACVRHVGEWQACF